MSAAFFLSHRLLVQVHDHASLTNIAANAVTEFFGLFRHAPGDVNFTKTWLRVHVEFSAPLAISC